MAESTTKEFKPSTQEYTINDIIRAIPEHCFHRSSLLSLAYVLRDFAYITACAALAIHVIPLIQTSYLRFLAWLAYSFCQGLLFTGLWELAHESGHGALSEKKWVNDAFGMVIHSALLVPFHSWKFTHQSHHKATNHIEKDIAFVPDIEDVWQAKRGSAGPVMQGWHLVEDMPIFVLLELVAHQLFAWPLYLLINNFALPRMAAAPWWKRSHFYFGGDGPVFRPAHGKDIMISCAGIAAAAGLIYTAVQAFGGWWVMKVYVFPWLWTNHWILTITFLQHTDVSVPFYGASSWTFLRGAAATIDRKFGFIGSHILHGALETHVLHHHVSRIPFYHAVEAAEAIKPVMGEAYRSDFETNYVWAFWKQRRACHYVNERVVGSKIYYFPKLE